MENSPINLKDFISDQKKQQEILGAQADIKFRFYQSALDLCETAKVGEFNSIRFGVSEYEMSLCGKWLMTDFSKEVSIPDKLDVQFFVISYGNIVNLNVTFL